MHSLRGSVILGPLVWVFGCSTQPSDSAFDLSNGVTAHTFRCPASWEKCYDSANDVCGRKGFEEIDRASAGSITSAGRMDDPANANSQGSGVYREDVRQDDYDRVLTVRCK